MKIIITGGHHNCALVVAELLRKKGHEVFWFGHKYTIAGDKEPGAEFKEVTGAGFSFFEIRAGKFYRTFNPKKLAKIPLGFFQALIFLRKIKPAIIFSFGGYLAVPVVIAGKVLAIPSFTHEQTVVSGLANKLIGFFAKKIFLTWPQSADHFPKEKTVITGLPLRKEIFSGKKLFNNDLSTVYLSGGKQGAHILNFAVKPILRKILAKYNFIHQCGGTTVFRDYDAFKKEKEVLPRELSNRYLLKDYFFKAEMGDVFKSCDLFIGRSGAHTVYELLALEKRCLLIPIPWVSGNEQQLNAETLVKAGIGEILSQKDLTPESLWTTIEKIMGSSGKQKIINSQIKSLLYLDAEEKIVKEVENYFSEKK